nr:MAG TPA: hypothetical protein [Caudoviricetes sp.]
MTKELGPALGKTPKELHFISQIFDFSKKI